MFNGKVKDFGPHLQSLNIIRKSETFYIFTYELYEVRLAQFDERLMSQSVFVVTCIIKNLVMIYNCLSTTGDGQKWFLQ